MKNDVTFLVSSCDKYEDAWHPFFELLHIYGDGFRYPVVLNTETKQYASKHFQIRVINTPGKTTWSERMMNVLEKLKQSMFSYFLRISSFSRRSGLIVLKRLCNICVITTM